MPTLRRTLAVSSLVSLPFVGCGSGSFTPAQVSAPPASGATASPAAVPAPTVSPTVYPATPKGPPPVPPPDGQGNDVKLQKYIVVDQFGYRTKHAKVAVLVD